jgi:hypothetical protein
MTLESDLIICVLGTSPALLARKMGVPVCYLYSGPATLGTPYVSYGIPTLSSAEHVFEFIVKKILDIQVYSSVDSGVEELVANQPIERGDS